MEGPARVAVEPGTDLLVLVDGVVVQDRVDDLARRNRRLDRVEEADERNYPPPCAGRISLIPSLDGPKRS